MASRTRELVLHTAGDAAKFMGVSREKFEEMVLFGEAPKPLGWLSFKKGIPHAVWDLSQLQKAKMDRFLAREEADISGRIARGELRRTPKGRVVVVKEKVRVDSLWSTRSKKSPWE